MARQVEGVRTALQTNKMVMIPASAAVAEGLTFTVGQITWTTRVGGLMTMALEENQIQSAATTAVAPITSITITPAPTTSPTTPTTLTTSPTIPTTRPLLPRYNGKRVDNSDQLEAIDRADHKLSEAFDLVNSISGQTTRTTPFDCHGSAQPARVTTHERLGTALTIMTTPEGRTVQIKTTS